MDTGLNIFKHIDCPAGKKCTSVNCLFGHEKPQSVTTPEASSFKSQPPNNKRKTAHDDEEENEEAEHDEKVGDLRKRPRTHGHGIRSGREAPVSRHESPPTTKKIIPANSPVAGGRTTTNIEQNPASPFSRASHSPGAAERVSAASGSPLPHLSPANRGSSPAGKMVAHQASSQARRDVVSTASLLNQQPPAEAPLLKPVRKTETLNPRHLGSNPAKFEVRFKLVKLLHEQYARLNKELEKQAGNDPGVKKLLLSEQELIWMVLDEEEYHATNQRLSYSSMLKSRIVASKKLTVEQWKAERKAAKEKEEGAASKRATKSDEPVTIATGLVPAQEVQVLKSRLLTPIDKLAQYGYVPTVPTEDEIQKAKENTQAANGWEVCDRCTKRFQVFLDGRREQDGRLTSEGKCTYHSGKAYIPNRSTADRTIPEKQYMCCGENVGQSAGCTTRDTHVFRFSDPKRLGSVWNFAETPEDPDGNNAVAPPNRAVCFDCEMGYTSKGFELIRLTATSWPDGALLLDVLVRPYGEVLDLNSTYSGVWPEDLQNSLPYTGRADVFSDKKGKQKMMTATTTDHQKSNSASASASADEERHLFFLKDGQKRRRLVMVPSPAVARELFFSLITRDTPVIGHGLENDLNCLRVVHPTIVDTVLLFPHKRGLPMRNGLRMLCQSVLNRRIQVENNNNNSSSSEPGKQQQQPQGHDSAEDARAAGDLVRWRVKSAWEKMKREGWKALGDDELVPPATTAAAASSSSSFGGGEKSTLKAKVGG